MPDRGRRRHRGGARLGARCLIGANVTIGSAVEIGEDTRIGAGASLSHCIVGARVSIFPGVRIGQEGFGFAVDKSGHVRVPQLGRVLIEDDVEIGANTTIDRGAGPDTVLGQGCCIDNLVQIAHNVRIGRGTMIAAQSGVAGSARIGDFVANCRTSRGVGPPHGWRRCAACRPERHNPRHRAGRDLRRHARRADPAMAPSNRTVGATGKRQSVPGMNETTPKKTVERMDIEDILEAIPTVTPSS